jgi:hypothetical protein
MSEDLLVEIDNQDIRALYQEWDRKELTINDLIREGYLIAMKRNA